MESKVQSEYEETQKYLEKKRQEVYGQLAQIKHRNVVIKQKIDNREADEGVPKSVPDSQVLQENLVFGPKRVFGRDEKHQGDQSALLNQFLLGLGEDPSEGRRGSRPRNRGNPRQGVITRPNEEIKSSEKKKSVCNHATSSLEKFPPGIPEQMNESRGSSNED